MTKHLLPLLALAVLPLFPPKVSANDATKDLPPLTEPTTVLDPFEVTTNPFAKWGMGILARHRLLSGALTKAYVAGVISESPADDAGVQLGDEITMINGKPTSELYFKEVKKSYYTTERGEVITLELFNYATNLTRIAELKLRANRTWLQKEGSTDLNCWGIRVRLTTHAQFRGQYFPNLGRIARWETVEIVSRHRSKKHQVKTEQKPVYVVRRAGVITWADKSLTLIERENRIVEVIEADKVPESDDVVGRLVGEGAVLTLKTDGTYELKGAPVKTERVPEPPMPTSGGSRG